MGLNLDYSLGQTPLDEEESEGLKIPTVIAKLKDWQFIEGA